MNITRQCHICLSKQVFLHALWASFPKPVSMDTLCRWAPVAWHLNSSLCYDWQQMSDVLKNWHLNAITANKPSQTYYELHYCLVWCAGDCNLNQSCIRGQYWPSSTHDIQNFEHHTALAGTPDVRCQRVDSIIWKLTDVPALELEASDSWILIM